MASASFIVGIFGNIISILVFTSPIKTFWWIVKRKSTDGFKGAPYVTTFLSTSLWTYYGLLDPNGLLVVTVNGAGAVLQFIYVTFFLIYSPKDKKLKTAKLVGLLDVVFLGTVITVTLLAIHGDKRLTVIGVLCAALTIGMYAAPLSAMRTVIKTKSVKYMPFLLSFFLFLNGAIWSTYAVLVKDFFIGVPNAVGFALGSAQLILYIMYHKDSMSVLEEIEVQKDIEMGLPSETVVGLDHNNGHMINPVGLRKGMSLPKPVVARQDSLQKVIKTLSLGPYDLQTWDKLEDA